MDGDRAGEQLGGLFREGDEDEEEEEVEVRDERLQEVDKDDRETASRRSRTSFLRAKTCFDVKEYLRTADLLKHTESRKGKFLRRYSLFLAGEKHKDEEQAELKEQCQVSNTELRNLKEELDLEYEAKELDGFGKYLFGVILMEVKLVDQAREVLVDSCNAYPWNWSAWVALSSICVSIETLRSLQPRLTPHYMADFFVALTLQELQLNEEALDRYDQLATIFPSSRYLYQQIGSSQFSQQGANTTFSPKGRSLTLHRV